MNQENYQDQVPKGLLNKVMQRIAQEQQAVLFKRQLTFFIALLGLFTPAIYAAGRSLLLDFSQSGTGQYIQLLFSDFGSVVANWKDFGASLLEAMPTASLLIFTVIVFAALVIARYIFHSGQKSVIKRAV